MSAPQPSAPLPPPRHGTGLVDRINLAMHFRRYLKLFARRWLLLFVCTSLGLSYSLYKVFNTPKLFWATAELEITRKVQVSSGGAVVLDPADFFADQLRILQSGALSARVLTTIRSSTNPQLEPPNTSYSASRGQGSSFQLRVTSSDLGYARLYASNWAKAFILYKREQLGDLLDEKKVNFQQELIRAQANLDKAREKTEQYRKEHQIGSASDNYKAAQQQLEQLKVQLTTLQTQKKVLEQTSKEALASGVLVEGRPAPANKPAGNNPPGQAPDSADPLSKFTANRNYVQLRGQLNERRNDYNSRTNVLKPKHPYMVQLDQDIQKLNREIKYELDTIEDHRKATLDSLALNEDAIFRRIQELTKEVQDLAGVRGEFERLQQDEARHDQTILSLKSTLQQIDLSTSDEGQFSVVGDVASAAVDPRHSRLVLQGVALGFVIGLALSYFLNRLDDRLELAEDIEEELEVPVLGQIPQVDMRAVKEGYLLITKLQRHNMFAESIRGVRSAIMLGAYQGRKQALLISSAVPGDGKTTFTVNFAATLAIAGNRVLLVDADLRRGNVHNYFKLEREPGLTEVLTGEQHWTDVVKETELKGLRVICSGRLPPHPGELLVGPITQQFIEETRREFDYIVMDCPPLTAIDDTFSLIGLMDGLLFVVRSGQTSMRFAKTALAAVRQRGSQILGVVLNGITSDNPYYYYNYYYHAYYHRQEPTGPETDSPELPSAKKMASPRSRRYAEKTIAGEAMASQGQQPSLTQIEKEAHAKTQFFKARRAAQKPINDSPAPIEPVTASTEAAPAEDPKKV